MVSEFTAHLFEKLAHEERVNAYHFHQRSRVKGAGQPTIVIHHNGKPVASIAFSDRIEYIKTDNAASATFLATHGRTLGEELLVQMLCHDPKKVYPSTVLTKDGVNFVESLKNQGILEETPAGYSLATGWKEKIQPKLQLE